MQTKPVTYTNQNEHQRGEGHPAGAVVYVTGFFVLDCKIATGSVTANRRHISTLHLTITATCLVTIPTITLTAKMTLFAVMPCPHQAHDSKDREK